MTQHLLIRTTTEDNEYDPEEALRAYGVISALIPERAKFHAGSHELSWARPENMRSDEDRIVTCFELLDGSQLGDAIFGCVDCDSGVEPVERDENGDVVNGDLP